MPSPISSVLSLAELETIRQRLKALPEPPDHVTPNMDDVRGAIGVFLLVFTSVFPVAIPFLFMENHQLALRVSNATAIVMLFIAGYVYGRATGARPWLVGTALVILGGLLVGITISLGG